MKKKMIGLVLALVMVLTLIPAASPAKAAPTVYGDVNGDGVVDLKDILEVNKRLAETKEADASEKTYTLKDLLKLRKYVAELISTLDAE